MAYKLTPEMIEELASRKRVRPVAVENFLYSIDYTQSFPEHMANLDKDTDCYSWDYPTWRAIYDGIWMVHHGWYVPPEGGMCMSMQWIEENAEKES